jgi:hypothetical protein
MNTLSLGTIFWGPFQHVNQMTNFHKTGMNVKPLEIALTPCAVYFTTNLLIWNMKFVPSNELIYGNRSPKNIFLGDRI